VLLVRISAFAYEQNAAPNPICQVPAPKISVKRLDTERAAFHDSDTYKR